MQVLFSRSRARHTPPPPPDLRVVQRIIEIRTSPPENLQRTPGPRAILSYLHRDADLAAAGLTPPRSTRTIWKILRQLGYILDPPERKHRPSEPREPLQEVQMDAHSTLLPFPLIQKASTSMSSRCSILSMLAPPFCSRPRPMMIFMRKPRLLAVIAFLRAYGLPAMLTFDRDPELQWAVPVVAIFPPHCGDFCFVWALSLLSVRPSVQTQTRL